MRKQKYKRASSPEPPLVVDVDTMRQQLMATQHEQLTSCKIDITSIWETHQGATAAANKQCEKFELNPWYLDWQKAHMLPPSIHMYSVSFAHWLFQPSPRPS